MSPELLKKRAAAFQKARAFFAERDILEVDCPSLIPRANIDANIDVMRVLDSGYLHTSPEYAMKRLLAAGSGDIYYLGHVFRFGESGPRHTPEFTMAEWYRISFSFAEMIQETCEFLFLFFGAHPIEILSYKNAFLTYVGIDPFRATLSELSQAVQPYASPTSDWTQATYLHLLLSHVIEPKLGQNGLTVLTEYPPNEAALACVIEKEGQQVAERFEIYFQGIELANGYHELADAKELRRRFKEENRIRQMQGKEIYELDEKFLQAIGKDFPDCCGVSVGFDRAFSIGIGKVLKKQETPALSRAEELSLSGMRAHAPCISTR